METDDTMGFITMNTVNYVMKYSIMIIMLDLNIYQFMSTHIHCIVHVLFQRLPGALTDTEFHDLDGELTVRPSRAR